MAAGSKEEYLKRYMSGSSTDDQKKLKKKKLKNRILQQGRVQIYDDDIGLDKLVPSNLENTLEEDIGEEAPLVAGIVDDRPEHVKVAERSAKWKGLGDDNEKSQEQTSQTRHDSDCDNSPPRERKSQRKRHDSSDSEQEFIKKKRNLDASPPRKKRSLPKQNSNRHDPDSDQSPPRKRGQASDSDQSTPRKRTQASDSDQSPTRKRTQASDSDQSPPRKRAQASDSDQPPRKMDRRKELSPSPPRKSISNDWRKDRKSRWSNWEEEEKKEAMDSKGRDKVTLAGAVAGLSTAQQMRDETMRLHAKQDEGFRDIDAYVQGKDAETVVRRVRGKKKKGGEEEDTPEEIARKAAQKDQYDKWGKGLKQQEIEQANVAEALHEISKPLARRKDDEDLDRHLKDQDRDGDPMLAFIKKKQSKPKVTGGKIVVMPRYKGPQPPPNRYEIFPGYRWDGVDRSNGFEKKFFTAMASKQAMVETAYKWSVEDM